MTTKLFSELGLSPEIQKAVARLGFEQASPIQAEAIPILLAGGDVVGQSQTGSGKTVAFVAPALEKVDPEKRVVQVLILCPTRELAVQVSEEVHKLAFFKRGLRAMPIYGGQSYERQFYGLQQGVQIVIGTPGRVMDHMRRGTLRLDQVRVAVLDEADVMLDMGFRDDIEFILQAVPATRQTVFFCATLPRAIQDLIQRYARDPRHVRIEQKTLTVPTVEQLYYEVDRRFKVELLTRLIDLHDLKLGIIFCNTKAMVDDLVDHLNAQGYSADRLHGAMTQVMRDRVMQKFRKSGLEFLVATDVAARGIDVDDVEVVFNYDLPYDVEDYVHRIGRTGRAGRSGRAISFASGREVFQIQHIERYTRMKIQRARIPTAGEVEEARAGALLGRLRAILQGGEFKKQEQLIEPLLEEGFASTDIAAALIHLLQTGEAPATGREPAPDERAPAGPPAFHERWSREPERPLRRDRRATAPFRSDRPEASAQTPPPARRPAPVPPAAPAAPPAAPTTEIPAEIPTEIPAVSVPPVEERPLRRDRRPTAPLHSDGPEVSAQTPPPAPPSAPVPAAAPEAPPKVSLPPVPAPVPVSIPKPKGAVPPSGVHRPVAGKVSSSTATDARALRGSHPEKGGGMPAPHKPLAGKIRKNAPWTALHGPDETVKPAGDAKPKLSRRTPDGQTRLFMNIGEEMGVTPADVVNAIQGETGLPAKVVGEVDIRERHLFVDVVAEHANSIASRLNRAQVKGRKVKVKVA